MTFVPLSNLAIELFIGIRFFWPLDTLKIFQCAYKMIYIVADFVYNFYYMLAQIQILP